MDIEQLKNFLAAAQLGSFQRVADQQFISQRTVSKQMTSLEDELGVQLFFRGPNKITLTNAGTYFVAGHRAAQPTRRQHHQAPQHQPAKLPAPPDRLFGHPKVA